MEARASQVLRGCADVRTKEDAVTFTDVLPQYSPSGDVTIHYSIGSRVSHSSSDWIGIFPIDNWEISNPLTFLWVPVRSSKEAKPCDRSATFPSKFIQPLKHPTATYQFLYVNRINQCIGASDPFMIKSGSWTERHGNGHVALPGDGSNGPQSVEGDANLRHYGSPALHSSDEEWDRHTHSSRQNSTSSFSDLSDLVIASAALPMEAMRAVESENFRHRLLRVDSDERGGNTGGRPNAASTDHIPKHVDVLPVAVVSPQEEIGTCKIPFQWSRQPNPASDKDTKKIQVTISFPGKMNSSLQESRNEGHIFTQIPNNVTAEKKVNENFRNQLKFIGTDNPSDGIIQEEVSDLNRSKNKIHILSEVCGPEMFIPNTIQTAFLSTASLNQIRPEECFEHSKMKLVNQQQDFTLTEQQSSKIPPLATEMVNIGENFPCKQSTVFRAANCPFPSGDGNQTRQFLQHTRPCNIEFCQSRLHGSRNKIFTVDPKKAETRNELSTHTGEAASSILDLRKTPKQSNLELEVTISEVTNKSFGEDFQLTSVFGSNEPTRDTQASKSTSNPFDQLKPARKECSQIRKLKTKKRKRTNARCGAETKCRQKSIPTASGTKVWLPKYEDINTAQNELLQQAWISGNTGPSTATWSMLPPGGLFLGYPSCVVNPVPGAVNGGMATMGTDLATGKVESATGEEVNSASAGKEKTEESAFPKSSHEELKTAHSKLPTCIRCGSWTVSIKNKEVDLICDRCLSKSQPRNEESCRNPAGPLHPKALGGYSNDASSAWAPNFSCPRQDLKARKEYENMLLKDTRGIGYLEASQVDGGKMAMAGRDTSNVPVYPDGLTTAQGSSEVRKVMENKNATRDTSGRITYQSETVGDNRDILTSALVWPFPSLTAASSCFGHKDSINKSAADNQLINETKASSSNQDLCDFPPTLRPEIIQSFQTSHPVSECGDREEVARRAYICGSWTDSEHIAILDQALMSFLDENCQLKQELEMTQNELKNLKAVSNLIGQDEPDEGADRSTTSEQIKAKTKIIRHRRIPVIKCAEDVKSMVRWSEEVQCLKSKVKSSENIIKDLNVQLGAVKEALDVESKKTVRAKVKLHKLKTKFRELKVKVRDRQLESVKRAVTSATVGPEVKRKKPVKDTDPCDYEPPAKHRRMDTCDCTQQDISTRPVNQSKRPTYSTSDAPASQVYNVSHNTPPTKLSEARTNRKTDTRKEDIWCHKGLKNPCCLSPPVSRVLGCPKMNTVTPATDATSKDSWAYACAGPHVTSCHPTAIPSYGEAQEVQAQMHVKDTQGCKPCACKRPLEGHAKKPSYRPCACWHLCEEINSPSGGYNRGHKPAESCSCSDNEPKSRGSPECSYSHSQSCSFAAKHPCRCLLRSPAAERRPTTHEQACIMNCPLSTAMCFHSRHRNPRRCSARCRRAQQPRRSPVSFNNSSNKSPENCITDGQHTISPLSSPCILPVIKISRSRSDLDSSTRYTVMELGTLEDNSYHRSQTSNFSLHSNSYYSLFEHTDKSEPSVTEGKDSDFYWPSTPAPEIKGQLHVIRTACKSPDNTMRIIASDEGSKLKHPLVPYEASQTSPGRLAFYQESCSAFASGATVSPESGDGDKACGNSISDWINLPGNHASSRSFLGIFTSPSHVSSEQRKPIVANQDDDKHPHKHRSPNTVESSIYNQFQTCFIKNLFEKKRDNENQHLEVAQESEDSNQGCVECQNQQQLPTEYDKLKQTYTYPATPFSLPPSELPYPPISPFHRPPPAHVRKATCLRLSEIDIGNHSSEFQPEMPYLEDIPHNDFSHRRYSLVRQGGPTAAASSFFSTRETGVDRMSRNSPIFSHSTFFFDLGLQFPLTTPHDNSCLASESIFENSIENRHIEASAACLESDQK